MAADPVVVGSADQVGLVESQKGEMVREESFVQVEGTSLVEHHKAYQEIQAQEDHLDPSCRAGEDRMEDSQDVDRKEGQEEGQEEDHVVVVARPELVAVVLEGLVEQKGVVGLDVETFEEPVLEVALTGQDVIRSAGEIGQKMSRCIAIRLMHMKLLIIRRKATEISTRFCALGDKIRFTSGIFHHIEASEGPFDGAPR